MDLINRYRSAGRAVLAIIALSLPLAAGQILVGTQPYLDARLRYSVDIFPCALGFRRGSDIIYWHGIGTGIIVEEDTRTAGLSYGLCFVGMNSGGVFAGPLFNITNRSVGFSLDITYSFFSVPLKISLQRTTAGVSDDMLFSVAFSGGIGLPYPLIRLEGGRFRHLFDQ